MKVSQYMRNMTIGRFDKNGTIRNSYNMIVGKVQSDGTVRDKSNMYVGKIDSDGTVRNGNSMIIGYAKGVPEMYAAVFYFFDFFRR